MKIWFDHCWSWVWDETKPKFLFMVELNVHKRKEWKGFSFYVHFCKWVFWITAVDNAKEYDRIINRRVTPRIRKKPDDAS